MLWLVVITIGLVVVWRGALHLGWPRRWQWLFALLCMGFVVHYPLASRLWGSMASLELPRPLLLVLSVGSMTVLLWAVLLLFKDAAALLLWLAARLRGRQSVLGGYLQQAAAVRGLLLLSLALAGVGVWQAVRVPSVKRVEIALAGLPAECDGYRLVHLTDLHVSRLLPGSRLQAIVAASNRLQPDAVMISGDLVDGTVAIRQHDYPPFADFRARDGVFMVPGNHEYYSGYAAWLAVFRQAGMQVLVNEHRLIRRGNSVLAVAGVSDRVASRSGLPLPDVAAAVAGIPAGTPIILLDHRPGNFLTNRQHGVALQLSGHTHGGHIYGFDRIVAAANNGYVSGHYRAGDSRLYLNNGAGLWSGFAIRLGPAAEITEITLRRAAN